MKLLRKYYKPNQVNVATLLLQLVTVGRLDKMQKYTATMNT